MKRTSIFLISLLVVSCELATNEPIDITAEELLKQQTEIIQLSESIPCTNASEWKTTRMGNKACGGPASYIAYHQSLEREFLDLVNHFNALEKEYIEKNNLISDCKMLVVPPAGVRCEKNKPVLIY
jgi:hypothetical protein